MIDYEELEEIELLHTTATTTSENIGYWLASRYNDEGLVYNSIAGVRFKLHTVDYEEYEPSGSQAADFMIGIYGSDGYISDKFGINNFPPQFFRPVFLLKGDLQITTGNGQQATPYELGV